MRMSATNGCTRACWTSAHQCTCEQGAGGLEGQWWGTAERAPCGQAPARRATELLRLHASRAGTNLRWSWSCCSNAAAAATVGKQTAVTLTPTSRRASSSLPCSNIGDGGNKEGPDKKYYQRPPYSAFREPSFGHGTLDLLDTTHAGADNSHAFPTSLMFLLLVGALFWARQASLTRWTPRTQVVCKCDI